MGQKPVSDRIRSAGEFKTLLDTLCSDLATANAHYDLFKKLLKAKEGDYTRALSQSQTFWALTYGAHYDAAVFRLCRAYDQDSGALSLRTLLETITVAPPFLPHPQRVVDPARVDADLKFVSHESNQVVKHLMIWRHKVFSHRDVEKTLTGGMERDYPVTHADVMVLLDQAFTILNRYNVSFFGAAFDREVAGNADYLKVLQTLQDAADAKMADLRETMRRVRQENETLQERAPE